MQGDALSPGICKIRLAIVSQGKCKSGGARVITYTICASEGEGGVYLVEAYNKSDFSTVILSILKKIISKRVIIGPFTVVKGTRFFSLSVLQR